MEWMRRVQLLTGIYIPVSDVETWNTMGNEIGRQGCFALISNMLSLYLSSWTPLTVRLDACAKRCRSFFYQSFSSLHVAPSFLESNRLETHPADNDMRVGGRGAFGVNP